jgi:hypothetical protein
VRPAAMAPARMPVLARAVAWIMAGSERSPSPLRRYRRVASKSPRA